MSAPFSERSGVDTTQAQIPRVVGENKFYKYDEGTMGLDDVTILRTIVIEIGTTLPE